MKKIIGLLLLVTAFLAIAPRAVQAQDSGHQQCLEAMHRLAANYQAAAFLRFEVLYRYANTAKPQEYLDSLRGEYKINGTRYWSLLNQQETLVNGDWMVMVFPEDSLLYLSQPGKHAIPGGITSLPTIVDSLLLANPRAQWSYAADAQEERVTMEFPVAEPYKKITWHIDRQSGYLSKMVSLLPAAGLYDPAVQSLLTPGEPTYVVVETLYRQYRQDGFDENLFDAGRYFRKQGTEYVATGQYEHYKIHLGKPGL